MEKKMDTAKVINDLKKSVVRLVVSGIRNGNGFFIAPGIILTCIHLVEPKYYKMRRNDLEEKLKLTKIQVEWNGIRYRANVRDFIYCDDNSILLVKIIAYNIIFSNFNLFSFSYNLSIRRWPNMKSYNYST